MRFCVWNPRVHRENVSISERRLLTYGCETRRGIEYKQKDLWCGHRRILLVPGGDWRADYGAGAGLAALWGVHTFLSVAKEKCAKESQRHGTTGKSPLLPILTAGLATSRAISLASYLLRSRALLCSPFSAVKMGGLFSLRCLTPLCSLAVGTGRTQIAVLGSYSAAWRLRSAEKQTLFFPLQLAQGMLNQCQLGCCDMP